MGLWQKEVIPMSQAKYYSPKGLADIERHARTRTNLAAMNS
jgi:hypothetical protein